MVVVWLFLTMSWVCLQFVIVIFPDHTYFFLNHSDLHLFSSQPLPHTYKESNMSAHVLLNLLN